MKQITIKADIVAMDLTIEVSLPEYLVLMYKIVNTLAEIEEPFNDSPLSDGIDFLTTECNKILAEVLGKNVMDIECIFSSLKGDEGDSAMRIRVVSPNNQMEQMNANS